MTIAAVPTVEREPLARLTRDIKGSAGTLGIDEIRYLVDLYYELQKVRIGTGHQERQLNISGEPHALITWCAENFVVFERNIKSALDAYTNDEPSGMGAWAKSITGIGPVLSAGLLAHIDIERAPTVGHIWRYAGLDPSSKWEKKSKRPWNASLKVLCFKIGKSFIMFQNHPKDQYGRFFVERKAFEAKRNDAGANADRAAEIIASKRFATSTDAHKHYSAGKLPPAHIDARARRWVVKLFLAHWHAEAFRRHYGTEPPAPYPIAILGHAHTITAPN
jgi:hypothetical protein